MKNTLLCALAVSAVLLAEDINPEDIPVPIHDVEPITVPVYTVEIPEVPVFTVTVPEVPVYGGTAVPADFTVTYEYPAGAINIPAMEIAIQSVDISLPTVTAISAVSVTPAEIPVVNVASIAVPDMNVYVNRLVEIHKFMDSVFADKRMLAYDSGINVRNEGLSKWLDIYKTYTPGNVKVVPYDGGRLRMIAEARTPRTSAQWSILEDNLDLYKKRGFNAVLVALRPGDDITNLSLMVNKIKTKGYKIWFAWSGPESLTETLFTDPYEIDRLFSVVAPMADGMFIGWRRTSVHLFLMDPMYSQKLVTMARKYNNRLYVFGEGYYGQTAASNENTRWLTYNMPKYVSGCLIVGVGYNGVNIESVMSKLFGTVSGMPRIVCIVGDRPYYATRYRNGRDFNQNLSIKLALEKAFISAGAIGTVILHGDGSDGLYDNEHTDNLSLTERR